MDEHDDLLQRLRTLGTQPVSSAQQSADLTAMAMVRPASRFGSKLRLAAAFLAGLLIGSTGLAAADALPDPAQHVAHSVLGRVGVDVPDPERYHVNAECGTDIKRNHGAYVRDEHTLALAQSDCGKKVKGAGDEHGTEGGKSDKGPCHGKPPWSGEAMTAEEKAAAQAARVLECGTEADDDAELDANETEAPAVEAEEQKAPEPTSTTTEARTTTEAPTTTVETTTTGETTTTTA